MRGGTGGQAGPEEQTCGFCGRYDEAFNDESLDIHYWKECPMLAQCWECGQVIEIATLGEHLLEECEQRSEYKLCSKCKGVFRHEDFPSHDCVRPKPQGAVKCQMCKESLYPANEIGWRKHLLEDKCTANPRVS
jgi:centrosomal protein CEP104